VEGEIVLEEILTQLTESVPGAAGLTKLDLHARRLFAHGLLPLVYSGEVPTQDKQSSLDSLRERPIEAFDFHNNGASIAQWTRSQFEILSPRLSSVLGKASGASGRDTSYWLGLLFNYASRSPNEPSRTSDLLETIFGQESRFRSGAGFLDGLASFLNLITLIEPAVLVLDEVDGLSCDADSALRTASSLVTLRESAPRTSVVISVNDDVWDSAFAPRLPFGLRDRLEDVVIRLKSLTPEEARSLVTIRSGEEADKILRRLDMGSGDLYPRAVLKAAREAWDHRDDESIGLGTPPTAVEEETGSDYSAPPVAVEDVVKFTPSEGTAPVEAEEEIATRYPPNVVRRAALPRSFPVQRIRFGPPAFVESTPPPIPPAFPESDPPVSQKPVCTLAPSASGQTPTPTASPFQVSASQSSGGFPPPTPVQPSPFQASQTPAAAPEIAQAPWPFEPQQETGIESEDQRSRRSYPAYPSDPPIDQDPFVPPASQQIPPSVSPPSPFDANLVPRGAPPQPQLPKGDTDAIDELLRQFRDHRNS
jgi:hypothetical protein